MLKEIVEGCKRDDVRLYVVWMPMLPTDSQEAADVAAGWFRDARVSSSFDPQLVVGLEYTRGPFANCLSEALSVMPQDHSMRETLEEWSRTPGGPGPVWDAVLFYEKGVEWKGAPPKPHFWSKQVGFWGPAEPGKPSGLFFRNDCKALPVESDWHDETRQALAALLAPPAP